MLPISARLAGVLEMAKTDPAGEEYKPTDYVFGEVGARVDNIKRSWETAVLKAHGHDLEWRSGCLTPASRAELRAIDLHFHETCVTRLGRAGWRRAGRSTRCAHDMLGHATSDQTDTYLNAGRLGLHEEMQRFDGLRCNPVANNGQSEHPTDRNGETTTTEQVTVN